MVFVTVGTQNQQFTRVIDYVINSKELASEQVIIQAGNTKYVKEYDKNRISIYDFLISEEYAKCIENCNMLITHGGVGSIFAGILNKKKVIAIPRLSKYHEHVNDHQLEICEKLYNEGYIFYLKKDEESLKKFDELVKKIKKTEFKEYVSDNKYLDILEKEI